MSKSLRVKLVFIMLLIIVLLMTVVLVFLVRGVQDFYTNQFYSQMTSIFTQTELVRELRLAAGENDAVSRMDEILLLFLGDLGIDKTSRKTIDSLIISVSVIQFHHSAHSGARVLARCNPPSGAWTRSARVSAMDASEAPLKQARKRAVPLCGGANHLWLRQPSSERIAFASARGKPE